MPTLLDVRSALSQGDHKRARQLLETVLKESPSADGWHLAAEISRDRDLQIKYLRRALAIAPKHRQARELLHEVGGDYEGFFKHLLGEIKQDLKKLSASSGLPGRRRKDREDV